MAEVGGDMSVHALVFTDPACPYSWAAEPALRALRQGLGAGLTVRYVMGGLQREYTDHRSVMRQWLDAAAASGMPVDPRLWLDDPPRSTHPACLGVKAAAEQGLDGAYLRRAREAFAYERRPLDSPAALTDLARTVDGLDAERFRRDLGSSAIMEAFGADLELTRTAAPELRGDAPRVAFPSVCFRGPAGERWAYDTWDVSDWATAAREAGARPDGEPPAVREALRRFGAMGTPEVAAVCGLPGPRAAAELWRAAVEWQVRAERLPCGELWRVA